MSGLRAVYDVVRASGDRTLRLDDIARTVGIEVEEAEAYLDHWSRLGMIEFVHADTIIAHGCQGCSLRAVCAPGNCSRSAVQRQPSGAPST